MMAGVALLAGIADAHVYHWQTPMTECPAECQGPLCPDLCSPTCADEWDEPKRWVLAVCEQPPCPGGVCPPPIACKICAFDTFPDDASDDATISFRATTGGYGYLVGSFTMQLTTWLIDVLTIEAGAANANGYTLTFESESSPAANTLTPDYVIVNAKQATLTIIVSDGARIVTD